jgi:hypothetical protein
MELGAGVASRGIATRGSGTRESPRGRESTPGSMGIAMMGSSVTLSSRDGAPSTSAMEIGSRVSTSMVNQKGRVRTIG